MILFTSLTLKVRTIMAELKQDLVDADLLEERPRGRGVGKKNGGRRPQAGPKKDPTNADLQKKRLDSHGPGEENGGKRLPPWAMDKNFARNHRPGGKNRERIPPEGLMPGVQFNRKLDTKLGA